ncbi:MAG TPA: lysylphosphatidylglycerol synthase transmembrane domain-containing protein [Flavisolibacter sp.]|nr:lysylphosphatidylglycerol synthase transmembrane domain-containing protein [Flavisolibacter sp.]
MQSEADTVIDKKDSKAKKLVKLLIKVLITVVCFWYISKKIDFSQALQSIKNANWLYLFLSVVLYILSKIIAAYRLNIYFKNIRLHLSFRENLKLYWLGMFYNLFLPGSISGDAYKVVMLNKRLKAPYKKTSAAVLLDRFSGLLGLGIILCVYGVFVLDDMLVETVLIAGCLATIGLAYFVVRKLFREFIDGFFPTFFWGIAVQGIQVIGVYLILSALGIEASQQQWIFIFLSASVISVLPISLGGGLGTREVVFTEGAYFFHLDPHLGVIISLLFYLGSVAGSIAGAYFIFHDPLKGMEDAESKICRNRN